MKISKNLKPLFKYAGGKFDEIKYFEKYIPTDFDTYIEPFVGGGGVYFYLNHSKNVINDLHNEVYSFYSQMKENKQSIIDFMEGSRNQEEYYYRIRAMRPINQEEISQRFYYLRKTCYRGLMRYSKKSGFNVSYGNYKTFNFDNLYDERYDTLFQNTTIHNESFEKIFEKYNSEDNFVFLDPPYDSVFKNYGENVFDRDNHKKLFEYFKTTKNKCLMVIGKTDFIEDLYRDYIVDEYEKNYRIRIHSGRMKPKNTHLIIKNY